MQSHRTPETFTEIKRILLDLPGVKAVETNPYSGSVVISYNPDTLEVGQLLRAGSALGLISADPNGAGSNAADWRSQVDIPRVARNVAVLAAAAIGAAGGPVIGLSRQAGSIAAAAAFILIDRKRRRASRGNG